jgi:glycosyltransferase involved in cell wall biosynthesis
MMREIRRLAGETRFDAVHADQLWMAPYAMLARRASPAAHVPSIVLDQHNAVCSIPKRLAGVESNFVKRALLNLEAAKLARYERETCRKFDRVVWVTDEDRRALFPGREHQVIPIALESANRKVRRRTDARRVTFLGGLHWPPNAQGILWFRNEIWPRVRREAPGAVLTVVGKNAPAGLKDSPDASLEVTGYVEDTSAYLGETAVFIVPLLAGGGMRVKILDAWSWGLPVVSTTIGAEGIHTRHGENILLADEPSTFASAVAEILNNPQLAARLAAGGTRTLESHYDRRKVYAAWDHIYPCASFTSSLTRPA